jgi:hypothetical protein
VTKKSKGGKKKKTNLRRALGVGALKAHNSLVKFTKSHCAGGQTKAWGSYLAKFTQLVKSRHWI